MFGMKGDCEEEKGIQVQLEGKIEFGMAIALWGICDFVDEPGDVAWFE
jgi:hypothetical protein